MIFNFTLHTVFSQWNNKYPWKIKCMVKNLDESPRNCAKFKKKLITFGIYIDCIYATMWLHLLEKEMATHSSVLAWRIPGMGEPGGLPSQGSHRVGHNWSDLAAAAAWLHLYQHFWNDKFKDMENRWVARGQRKHASGREWIWL